MQLTTRRNIQALRGCAIFLVLLTHLPIIVHSQSYSDFVSNFNFSVGVDLFFIISGFLMMHTFFGKREKTDADAAFQFYEKRFRRIFAPTIFWALVVGVFGKIFIEMGAVPGQRELIWIVLSAMTFVSNFKNSLMPGTFGYFWSIALEMQFYLVLPLMFMFGKKWAWVIAGSALLFLTLAPISPAWFWQFRLNSLLFGVLLWKLLTSLPDSKWTFPRLMRGWFFPLYTIVLFVSAAAIEKYMGFNFKYSIIGLIMSVVFLVFFLSRDLVFGRFSAVLEWLGGISFSLYLCHIPVWLLTIYFARDVFGLSRDVYSSLGIILAFLAAALSRKYIETLLDRRAPLTQAQAGRAGS